MEYENKYASKGVAGTGLGLGIAGTALGLLGGNGLNGILGMNNNNCGCSENNLVNRYELSQSAKISELETELKLRDSNIYTDGKILDLYKYVDGKFGAVEAQIAQQGIYNATNTATLNCISGQVAQLMSLTKSVIPAENICPNPMPQYNSWTAPTA